MGDSQLSYKLCNKNVKPLQTKPWTMHWCWAELQSNRLHHTNVPLTAVWQHGWKLCNDGWLVISFLRTRPRATQHDAYSCYLMSCLVNVPLSSVRSRRLRCARLCLRDGSAYTSFLRIHTQGSSRQSNLWGDQQHTHSVFNCRENTNKHTYSLSFSSCQEVSHTQMHTVS